MVIHNKIKVVVLSVLKRWFYMSVQSQIDLNLNWQPRLNDPTPF